jgi:hypothetical protein
MSESIELFELTDAELDAVSGGQTGSVTDPVFGNNTQTGNVIAIGNIVAGISVLSPTFNV